MKVTVLSYLQWVFHSRLLQFLFESLFDVLLETKQDQDALRFCGLEIFPTSDFDGTKQGDILWNLVVKTCRAQSGKTNEEHRCENAKCQYASAVYWMGTR